MSELIFLDIDGVLNTHETLRAAGKPDVMNPDNVLVLNHLVEQLDDPKVIISSTWRILFPLNEIYEYLVTYGYTGPEPSGRTPNHQGLSFYGASPRGYEIQAFLEDYPPEQPFVVLDDHDDWGDSNRVQAHWVLTNPEYGLTMEDVGEALEILDA